MQVKRSANQVTELRRVAKRCELWLKLLALELRLEDEGVEGSMFRVVFLFLVEQERHAIDPYDRASEFTESCCMNQEFGVAEAHDHGTGKTCDGIQFIRLHIVGRATDFLNLFPPVSTERILDFFNFGVRDQDHCHVVFIAKLCQASDDFSPVGQSMHVTSGIPTVGFLNAFDAEVLTDTIPDQSLEPIEAVDTNRLEFVLLGTNRPERAHDIR